MGSPRAGLENDKNGQNGQNGERAGLMDGMSGMGSSRGTEVENGEKAELGHHASNKEG